MKKAIRPNFYQQVEQIGQIPAEDSNELSEETVVLNTLGLSKGWKVLVEYIEAIEEELDKSVLTAEETGASFDEIGQRTVVKDLCKYVTKRIKQRVSDSVESVEQHRESK